MSAGTPAQRTYGRGMKRLIVRLLIVAVAFVTVHVTGEPDVGTTSPAAETSSVAPAAVRQTHPPVWT